MIKRSVVCLAVALVVLLAMGVTCFAVAEADTEASATVVALGVSNGEIVNVKVETEGRTLIFGDVVVRVSDSYGLAMHIDTDESNAAACGREQYGEIVK